MQPDQAVTALASLAQEHRLSIFRLLVQAGSEGLAAGAIAEKLGVPPSSLSFHLTHLTRAGLISQERQSRTGLSPIYSKIAAQGMPARLTFLHPKELANEQNAYSPFRRKP